jgi:hypothetical protein
MKTEDIKACSAWLPVGAERDEAMRKLGERQWRRSALSQLGLFLLALALWPVPVINPVKLMVVLFHELAHVVAAYLTGGVVFGIAIDPGGAGATLWMGGNQLAIVAAGYAGSLAVGLFLYTLSALWDSDEVWTVLCCLCCLSLAFGWINDFTAVFGYGTIALMIAGAFYISEAGKKAILRWVATTCCLYPAIDVAGEVWFKSDGYVFNHQRIMSDVSRLSQLTGLDEAAIGGVWVVTGLALLAWMIVWSARKDSEGVVRHKMFFFRRTKEEDMALAVLANDPYDEVRWKVK